VSFYLGHPVYADCRQVEIFDCASRTSLDFAQMLTQVIKEAQLSTTNRWRRACRFQLLSVN